MGKLPSVRTPITYDELKPGSHLIRNNTRSKENEDGTFNIYLHGNLIAVLYFDGSVRIYSGGWKTKTTRQRLDRLLTSGNWNFFTDRGKWNVYSRLTSREPVMKIPFTEGMLISPRS